jgi:hypothetical protein
MSRRVLQAATRSGETEAAAHAGRRLAEMTSASGTDWGLGIQARSWALLSEGEEAERLYREAIERLSRTRIRIELARAHLLYGEWLRRERRRGEARDQLRTACSRTWAWRRSPRGPAASWRPPVRPPASAPSPPGSS